ncbi:uncharacterized protein with ParB-like and HNH nuclease domain [Desulfomicrobium macestii]|uniref:Uncharacterized protein with ParB-like and HNH nuclease domain n=1 Tax=Desulfomicrobium macestii TaxID=90731 RepID=A0ABR9H752_9BACT|nr:DUF262 domain-containing protein [Desulfomicrobium macestii]MBE1426525.1 uncharacterized protein with ParB-like and HNH nuclease domain [Desulfomicrobium macestii]
MSFQTPITISEAIENISTAKYVLPAIQREFVWPSYKIEWLFDSLMRSYPVSSFLFWNVEGKSVSEYKFYHFLKSFRERFNTHNIDIDTTGTGNFIAVLDGQQRLTSLYIGLKGSYAYREKHKHWNNDEWSIPTRHLYLNITKKLDDQAEEDGRVYEFSFLKESDTNKIDIYNETWFRVGKILDLQNISSFNRYVRENNISDTAADILARLQEVIFSDRIINFFLEKDQDLHKALNIFIRINSGGLPLNFSDLIMSIAIANWNTKDARKEIHNLVDRIQEKGFSISKDLIFKTYLYLFSKDIRFKVTNFSSNNAHNFENYWDKIRDAISAAFDLIKGFGYTDFTLTSKNATIPIIYYIYHKNISYNFCTSTNFKEDREIIKKWLHVMTIKRIFGGQSDGTLAQIRKAFTNDINGVTKIYSQISHFPANEINSQVKRDISIGDEFIEEIIKTQKDDRYAFSILALLYPNLDYRNNDFHKDHLHSASSFTQNNAKILNLSPDDKCIFLSKEWNNSIINLQLLDSNENMSKQDKSLSTWFELETKTRDKYTLQNHYLIPADTSLELKDFAIFANARKNLLKEKLWNILK